MEEGAGGVAGVGMDLQDKSGMGTWSIPAFPQEQVAGIPEPPGNGGRARLAQPPGK